MFETVLRFWLDRGVDGFRVDVAHGLFKEASLRDQVVGAGEEPAAASTIEHAMVERALRDEPMWDQPEVHDVYRRWRQVLAEYAGDRMAVAEAWTQTAGVDGPLRPRRRDAPGVQLRLAAGAVVGRGVRRGHRAAPSTPSAAVDGAPTWVLSNHDVVRHATRYGGGAGRPGPRPGGDADDAGAARLGVPLPGRGARPRAGRRRPGGPPGPGLVPHRRARSRRLPGADPVVGRRAAVRLRPGHRPAVAAAAGRLGGPDGRGRRRPTPSSTLAFYRRALAARREHASDAAERGRAARRRRRRAGLHAGRR